MASGLSSRAADMVIRDYYSTVGCGVLDVTFGVHFTLTLPPPSAPALPYASGALFLLSDATFVVLNILFVDSCSGTGGM